MHENLSTHTFFRVFGAPSAILDTSRSCRFFRKHWAFSPIWYGVKVVRCFFNFFLNLKTHNYLHCSYSTYDTTHNTYSTYNTKQYKTIQYKTIQYDNYTIYRHCSYNRVLIYTKHFVFLFLKRQWLRSKCTKSQKRAKCTVDQDTLMTERQGLLYVFKNSYFLGSALTAEASVFM